MHYDIYFGFLSFLLHGWFPTDKTFLRVHLRRRSFWRANWLKAGKRRIWDPLISKVMTMRMEMTITCRFQIWPPCIVGDAHSRGSRGQCRSLQQLLPVKTYNCHCPDRLNKVIDIAVSGPTEHCSIFHFLFVRSSVRSSIRSSVTGVTYQLFSIFWPPGPPGSPGPHGASWSPAPTVL